MMLFLLLGIQFMGVSYAITQKSYSIGRQIISALFITISLLELNPLSNHKYKQFPPDESTSGFPFPELFLVLSFSLFLYVEHTLTFTEPPPINNLLEMETIKNMLHLKT